ncbi:hypothetical protein HDE_11707 [Halotydeus destructor]|nr:hypothetical protein HDE_11707 [Halotydeus destructor]
MFKLVLCLVLICHVTAADLEPVIISSTLSKAQEKVAFLLTNEILRRSDDWNIRANVVRKFFEQEYGGHWCCVVAHQVSVFGIGISYASNRALLFNMGGNVIFLWQE